MRGQFRITRAEAERLLDSGRGSEPVAAVMSAASRPAGPGEVPGESAALQYYRAAQLSRVPRPRRLSVLKTVLADAVAAKLVLGAAVAAAATGGIAVAAATGNLPGGTHHHQQHAAVGLTSHANARHHGQQAPIPQPTASATASSSVASTSAASAPTASGSAAATPSPSLHGLCTAFRAGATDNPGKALENPAFSALVAAAGGTDNVGAYCDSLLGPAPTHPAGTPSTHPGRGKPSTHPGGKPSTHPGGRPSTHPGRGSRSSHPGGTDHPGGGAPTTEPSGPPNPIPTHHG